MSKMNQLSLDTEQERMEQEVKEWEILAGFFPEPIELIPNSDTSTEAGRNWKIHKLAVENQERHIENLERKYRETGNKKYGVLLNHLTGLGDNFPQE